MKRFVILLSVLFFLAGVSVFADTSVLIDFSELVANTDIGENEETIIDFASKAGTGFSEEDKEVMKTSLAIGNWKVQLASSSQTVTNMRYSQVKEAPVSQEADKFAGETIMGVRVHFPTAPFNSWAMIRPPFEIPAYQRQTTLEDDGTVVEDETDRYGTKYDNKGVVKNVGVLKSVEMNLYCSNYPHGMTVVLKDQNNEEHEIFMGYLDHEGWRTITWENPNYITEVRNRELREYPLYPNATPYMKLDGIIVYKDSEQQGGDFITYVKDIKLTYDLAVLDMTRDIDEEALWGILDEREEARRTAEYSRLGEEQVMRYLESKKMHDEEAEEAEEENAE